MSAALEQLALREPMPQLTSFGEPTDDDLAVYAEWMHRVAFSPTQTLSDSAFVLGRLMAASEQMAKWLKARDSENAQLRRERDQYKLAAETNRATIQAMIAMRATADEVGP